MASVIRLSLSGCRITLIGNLGRCHVAPHNRGKRLTTNTSGLSAIRTGRARRASFSVDKHGQDGALGRAISKRLSGGYAVPGLAEC